jgi:hypothetical protein
VNTRARFALDALSVAAVRAQQWNCPLVILGDLFDRTSTDPRLIASTMAAIAPAPEVFVLLGNHDAVSAEPGDNALAPLRFVGGVGVVDEARVVRLQKPGAHLELLMVPWRPGAAKDWLPEAVYQLHDHARKMRTHSMEAPTPEQPQIKTVDHYSPIINSIKFTKYIGPKNPKSEVKELQSSLNIILTSKLVKLLSVDGVYGRNTISALKLFQKENNLKADGIFGPKTREVINKILATK